MPGGFLGRGDLADLCDAARGQGSLLGARYIDRAGRRLRGGVARGRRAGEDGVGAMVTQGRDAPGRGEADSFLICDQNCVIVEGRGTGSSREGLWDGGVWSVIGNCKVHTIKQSQKLWLLDSDLWD